ncbi:MAG: 4-hydroxy-tetrahydrodipicolinate synthase [Gammaproteobacteria bacterium]|nr:MAG: 4-hydroxy-tetrahydrodipicolinate synthase [Gammaproteobacteria bacterium]
MFKGSMVAIATPMHVGGEVDFDSLAKYVEFHIENDTDALVPAGTTGESATLNHAEHCEVIQFVVDQVKGRIPVIAGTGANSTQEAIELTQCAKDAGADACLLVSPYYNKPTQEGLILHHQAIAKAVAIPQILYNVPGRTAVDLLPETAIKLSSVDNIVGIKEATGEIDRCKQILAASPKEFMLISGDDYSAMEFLLAGGCGVITVTGNVAPKLFHDMCIASIDGDRNKAQEMNARLEKLNKDLFVESNPIPVKWCLTEMGLFPTGTRLPMTTLSEIHHETLRQALSAAGSI